MNSIALSAEMRRMDQAAPDCGTSGLVLMEHAAAAVTDAVCALRGAASRPGTAVVFCGSGNNGGDGVACARQLIRLGWTVRCVLLHGRHLSLDTAYMLGRLAAAGGQAEPYAPDLAARLLDEADVVVDALFGTGLNAPLHGDSLTLVQQINASGKPVVSCDVPSGVDADTGAVLGDAVRAAVTVSFCAAKPGLLLSPAMRHVGELQIADIGMPAPLMDSMEVQGELLDDTFVHALIQPRAIDAHKGQFGRILLLCGSVGLTGAAALAARAALRTGAGLISLGVPAPVYPILAAKLDEVMVFPLPADADGRLSEDAIPAILPHLAHCDACLIGPGLGQSDGVRAVVEAVLRQSAVPVIVDADGINVLSGHIDVLRDAACPVVLTPHDVEFQRLGGDLSGFRYDAVRKLAQETGAVVLLKGHRSMISDGSKLYVNTTGNPGMATGGSGDTLAGILLALLGFGHTPLEAAAAAAWLHGAAGDRAADMLGQYGMTPTDLIAQIPYLLP